MTYRLFQALALFGLAFLLAAGCGRSDLTVYTWGDGGPNGEGGACGPSTCPTGCCDPSGTCRTGTELNACGFGGGSCNDCQSQGFDFCDPQVKACGKTQTMCNASTCGAGCCTTFMGMAACVSGVSSLACGNGGAMCANCTTSGEQCDGTSKSCVNAASCGPNTCSGCCAGTTCVGMQSDANCGTGGLACTNCSGMGEFCNESTGSCTPQPPMCGPNNCTGCCAGNTCVTTTSDTQCGTGGTACSDCTTSGEKCSSGVCATACDPMSCPGCCSSNTCYAGFIDTRCGSGGASCVDCTASSSTCDTLTTPRICNGSMTTCPATYGSCGSSVSTPVLSVTSGACSASDLSDAQAACKTGETSVPCQSFISSEPSINAACASCLTPFYFDLNAGEGIFNCVSPFVSSTCNHDTGCVVDCETQSCDMCPSSSVQSCENTVATGQCSSYWTSSACILTSLLGGAAFCNPTKYFGNYGDWLAAVGAHYCE